MDSVDIIIGIVYSLFNKNYDIYTLNK